MFWIIILIILIVLLIIYCKWFKRIKLRNLCFVDGTLGSGKSMLSVCLAIRQYKKNLRSVKVKNFFRKLLLHKEALELPQLYSNMPLRDIEFTLLNRDLLLRKNYRFAYKSVLLVDEISLVADQMTFKDKELNERLSEFFKLFRHETRGGYIIINSQSVSDCHYSLKYSMSDYIYIHSKVRLPFFSILRLQERTYNADNSSVQMNTDDLEDGLKVVCVLNKYFKKYDTYYLSIYTDMLPVYSNKVINFKGDSLKNPDLLTMKNITYIKENLEKEELKNE